MIRTTRSRKRQQSEVAAITVTPPTRPRKKEEDNDDELELHYFNGIAYTSYQDMVAAKRQRNAEKLGGIVQAVKSNTKQKSTAGLPTAKKKKKNESSALPPRRHSSRLRGEAAENLYVEDESGGKIQVAGVVEEPPPEPEFYAGRVNNGEPLSLEQAVQACEERWRHPEGFLSASATKELVSEQEPTLAPSPTTPLTSEGQLQSAAGDIRIEEMDTCVAKVCPNRIYSVAFHPAAYDNAWLVAAGDKLGYVGLWKVKEDDDGSSHALFRPHTSAASCLQWTRQGLLSTSYDGTMRLLDLETAAFTQVFAVYTHDAPAQYQGEPGYGLDPDSRNFWIQYGCPDASERGVYVSTSMGLGLHVDWREKKRITFQQQMSEKKVNTLR